MTVAVTSTSCDWPLPSGQTIPNISGVSFSWGKRNILDDYTGCSGTFYGFNPTGFSVPPLGIGVSISAVLNIGLTVGGTLTDYRMVYGLKPSMDTYEMTWEGLYSRVARTYGSVTTVANASTYAFAQQLETLSGLNYSVGSSSAFGSTTSAQTITGTLNDMVQTLIRTEGGWVQEDNVTLFRSVLNGRNQGGTGSYSFTDIPGDGNYKYHEIEFRSAADNFANKVVVNATGFAAQTAGTGTESAQVSTINGSATEAANLAGYYNTLVSQATAVPFAIRSTGSINPGKNPTMANPAANNSVINITFRGTTYNCILIGADFDANGTDWSQTLYLTSSLAQSFLVLDSPTLGKLDTNKLGF